MADVFWLISKLLYNCLCLRMNGDTAIKSIGKEVVGLFPAGGIATRIAPIPCSKELFPVGFFRNGDGLPMKPKVVGRYMLEKMQLAGARKTYIILRQGKWDIPAYFGDGSSLGLHVAYLMMNVSYGVPFTIDQAYPFLHDATVLFGFPDIIFEPEDAFRRLVAQLDFSGADIVLGLFPAHSYEKMDMVSLDGDGLIREIVIKPVQTSLFYTWIIAAWNQKFTQFIHDFVCNFAGQVGERLNGNESPVAEIYLGDVIQAAIHEEITISSVKFDKGSYLDIGTPEDLEKAVSLYGRNTRRD